MKLHANAALSLNKRRLLVRRIVEEGWPLTKAAEAAEVERAHRRQVGRPLPRRGRVGLYDRSSAAQDVHNRTDEQRISVICALRRLRMTGAEIAEVLGMAETTVSGILTRSGWAGSGASASSPRFATSARARASSSTSTSRSSDASRAAPGIGSPATRSDSARDAGAGADRRLGVRPRLRRRRHPLRLRRGPRRREGNNGGRLPASLPGPLPPPRGEGRGADDRQRLRLRLGGPRDRLPGAGAKAHSHPPLPPADQRQGRALHPHDARRLGLRRHLPKLAPSAPRRSRAGSGATTSSAIMAPSAGGRRQLDLPS